MAKEWPELSSRRSRRSKEGKVLTVANAMREIAKGRKNLLIVKIGAERQAEDYLVAEKSAPTVYALLPGQVVLKLKDLTS